MALIRRRSHCAAWASSPHLVLRIRDFGVPVTRRSEPPRSLGVTCAVRIAPAGEGKEHPYGEGDLTGRLIGVRDLALGLGDRRPHRLPERLRRDVVASHEGLQLGHLAPSSVWIRRRGSYPNGRRTTREGQLRSVTVGSVVLLVPVVSVRGIGSCR